MKLLPLFLLLCGWARATTFTEFYVNPNAAAGCTNVNAGSTSTGTALYTSTATVAGGWNGASVFTPDDGSTPASTVSAGMWASVYTNGVNTNAVFVARITTVAAGVNGAITVDTTAKMGTAPGVVLGAVAAITIKVGGTWQGPWTNAAGGASVTFPFNFAGPNATNTAGSMTCINFIGGTNYNTSNAITHSVSGPMRWEGYTNTIHDGGRAVFNGGTVVAGYTLLTVSGNRNDMSGFDFLNNGSSGTTALVQFNSNGGVLRNCVFRGSRGSGLATAGLLIVTECESMTNNLSNTSNRGGYENATASVIFLRCISHDNTNANTSGFYTTQAITLINCLSFRNGLNGLTCNTTADPIVILNSDFYWNGSNGFDVSGVPAVSQGLYIENSNFITNGTIGINSSGAAQFKRNGEFFNNGFGSGSLTNSSGSFGINMTNVFQSGTITYASGVTPWASPNAGNFKINLGAAYGTGRGTFTETAVGVSGTVGFPSIGAAQPAGFTNATSSVFAQ